jgi:hypothetical protein
MRNIEEAIRIEKRPRKSGGPRAIYIFKCLQTDCNNEIKRRKYDLHIRSDYCLTHSHTKKPFESIYNRIINSRRGTPVYLTYEQFVKFTKTKECWYCTNTINWQEYSMVGGKYTSSAYYLDRKDNAKSYSIDNCVVCCTRCNKSRSNNFTYEEWYGMTSYFRNKQ